MVYGLNQLNYVVKAMIGLILVNKIVSFVWRCAEGVYFGIHAASVIWTILYVFRFALIYKIAFGVNSLLNRH